MEATQSTAPIYAPIYAAVAICGFVSSSVMALVSGIKSGTTTAASMPALAAAGLVWHTKNMLSKEETPSLLAQPSILNWHDLPAQE